MAKIMILGNGPTHLVLIDVKPRIQKSRIT